MATKISKQHASRLSDQSGLPVCLIMHRARMGYPIDRISERTYPKNEVKNEHNV